MSGAVRPIVIGARSVGPGAPAYLVAEIGINHNGDPVLAKATIEAAARAGADAVKFQNYRTEDFIADRSRTYRYNSAGRTIVESQYDMFKRYEMDDAMLESVVVHARSVGIDVHSTPTGVEGIAALVRLGVGVIKNGSDFLTNTVLIDAMARTGLPVVLSAGMATLEEIAAAVDTVRAVGNDRVIVLHCTSQYPAPPATLHLRAIPAIAGRFDCLAGFSDHSEGTAAAIVAVALGACWIEKHFTLDRTLPGPDHRFSSDEAEFRALVRDVRNAEAALADAPLGFDAAEAGMRADARLSCVAATALRRGHPLTAADIVFRRPGTGLPPAAVAELVGKRLRDDVAAYHPFSAADLSDP
jgi:N-acetylneuraminate synthase/N,N'-diacetyllegionaminate synthase